MEHEHHIKNYMNKIKHHNKQIFNGDTDLVNFIDIDDIIYKYITVYENKIENLKGIFFEFGKKIISTRYRVSSEKIIINFENIFNFNIDLFTDIKISCPSKKKIDYNFILYDNTGINEIQRYKNSIPILYTKNYILKLEIYDIDNINEININGIFTELVPKERKNFLNLFDNNLDCKEILSNSTWF